MKLHYFEWAPKDFKPNSGRVDFPLIFLHGMGGTGQIWRPIGAGLEDQFRCIALDQRGHGLSRPVPENKYHALDYARDAIETLGLLQIDSFFLIGHSMGVRTALAVAHLIPEKVKGLIAVDIGISSEWGGGIGMPLANFLGALPETFPDRASLKEYVARECPDPAIAQYLIAVSKKVSNENESSKNTSAEVWIFPFDHQALVKTIHQANDAPLGEWVMKSADAGVRMAFLRGENSKVWLKADYETQREKYKHPLLCFEEWENCGHGLPFEQRARFIQFIRDFVKV
jgi:pimeloyl-ACP methyl ester carboxylesterase